MNDNKNEECITNTDTIETENTEFETNPGDSETHLSCPGASVLNNTSVDNDLNKKLDALKEQLDFLATEFESKFKYDQFKEKIINDMHGELQHYKNDLIKNLLRPIVMDIIHTIDDITKLVYSHKSTAPTELDPQKLIKQMEGFSFDLIEILSHQGIEPFQDPQPEFDPKRQKIIKIESCNDPAKDKCVAQRHQPGYLWDGKVLRHEKVNVYVFEPGLGNPQTINSKEKES